MGISVNDLDQTEAWAAGAILRQGTHHVRVESVDDTTKSSGGHPQLEMEFVSESGVGAIRDWLVVIPATYGKVRQFLDACGIETEGGNWQLPVDRIKGAKLYIDVMEEPKLDDPTKTVSKVVAYRHFDANDLPGPGGANDDIPF